MAALARLISPSAVEAALKTPVMKETFLLLKVKRLILDLVDRKTLYFVFSSHVLLIVRVY